MARKTSATAKRMIGGALATLLLVAASAAMAQSMDLDKAVATAGKWIAQADANQPDAMWKASSFVLQKSVTQENWGKYISGLRDKAGNEQERSWVAVSKIDNPQGLPAGQYLNVMYATKFAKAMTLETVSMAKGSSGWEPIGYVVREANPGGAAVNNANATKPAVAPAQPAAGK
ncbi:DUF4019 domain-containing protein [Dyella acidisoli]|uniref:DUF4019 domain-containing protein n=1 Tax=Dyella acidisoli TaxID=1867834 RepID=A0ABQ5XN18_9GAMM|nr:DUF4019 domain-containing protein [Dyella acidisoli]GLQ91804.1 hypothetical protein GCM10007901_07540 [Dyella acidisoli]